MAGPWEAYQTSTSSAKPWEAYQSKPLPGKTDDGLSTGSQFADKALTVLGGPAAAVGYLEGEPEASGKTIVQGIKDLPSSISKKYDEGGQQFAKDFEQAGTQSGWKSFGGTVKAGGDLLGLAAAPVDAAVENTYGRLASEGAKSVGLNASPSEMAIVPEMMTPGGEKKPLMAALKNPKLAEDLLKMHVDLSDAKDADSVMGTFQKGIKQTGQDLAGAGGVAPLDKKRDVAAVTAEGLGKTWDHVKKTRSAMFDDAKADAALMDTNDLDEIEKLRHISGETATQGAKAELEAEEKLNNIKKSKLAGEDIDAETKAAQELKDIKLANKRNAINGKTAFKVETGEDLINLKQRLNKVDTTKFKTAEELADHEDKVETVDRALEELANRNAKLGTKLKDANAYYAKTKDIYEGKIAGELGINKDLLSSLTRRNLEGNDNAARLNAISAAHDIANKIDKPEHIEYLRAAFEKDPEALKQVLASKMADIIEEVGTSPQRLKKNRELIESILDEGMGVKDQKYKKQLDALQTVFDRAGKERLPNDLPSRAYRGEQMGYAKRLATTTWGAILAMFGHTYGGLAKMAGGAKAAEDTLNAKNLLRVKGEVTPKKSLIKNIPGEAIGATLKGTNAYENQR